MFSYKCARHLAAYLLLIMVHCTLDRSDFPRTAELGDLTAEPTHIVADGQTPARLVLSLRNAQDQPAAGVLAQFGTDNSTLSLTAAAPTDRYGLTSCLAVGTRAGPTQVWATWPGSLGEPHRANVALVLMPQEERPQDGNIQASPTQIRLQVVLDHEVGSSDTNSPTIMTLVVKDAAGKPLAGQTVFLTTLRPGDTVFPTTAVTDTEGKVRASVSGSMLGLATIRVRVGETTTDASVNIVSGSATAAKSLFSRRQFSAVADGQERIDYDVLLKDADGRPVPYALITFASDVPSDVFEPFTQFTDSQGVAATQLRGTKTGLRMVMASVHEIVLVGQGRLTTGAPNDAQSTLVMSPTTLTADGLSPSYMTIKMADAFGNPIKNAPITLSSTVAADRFVLPRGLTDDTGIFQAVMTGAQAGPRVISAASPTLTLQQAVTLVAGPPNSQRSTWTTAGLSQEAGQPAGATFTLRDAQDNPIPNVGVVFAGSDPSDTFVPRSGVTDSLGRVQTTFTGTRAGSHSLIASLSAGGMSLNTPISVTASRVDAATSRFDASTSMRVADGASGITLTVRAQDRYGNRVVGAPASMGLSGPGVVLSADAGSTDANGLFSVSAASTVSESKQATAVVQGISLMPITLNFVDGPPHAAASALTVAQIPTVADGVYAVAIDVWVRDALGNALEGQPVTLEASGTGVVLTPGAGLTDAAGHISAQVQSTRAEAKTITAHTGDVTLVQSALFVPGPVSASKSYVTCSPSTLTADGQSRGTLQLVARDAFENTVPHAHFVWSIDRAGATLLPSDGTTDDQGFAAAQLSALRSGPGRVKATLDGNIVLSVPVRFVPGPADVSQSSLTLSPNPQIADGSPMVARLLLQDAQQNPISDTQATFSIAGTATQIRPLVAVTDAAGRTATQLTSTVAEEKFLSVQAGNLYLQASGIFKYGVAVAERSKFTVPSTVPVADGNTALPIIVNLQDAYNNAVPGVAVTFKSDQPADRFIINAGATDAMGDLTASVTTPVAGTRILQAATPSFVLTASGTFAIGPPSAAASIFSISPNAILADDLAQSSIRWALRDQSGNALPAGTAVIWSHTGVGQLTASNSFTDANGVATTALYGPMAGQATVSASANGLNASGVVTLLPGPSNYANSLFVAGADNLADGQSPVSLTVTVRDARGNVIPQAQVQFNTDVNASVTPSQTMTDASGVATAQVTSTVAGLHPVTAASWGTSLQTNVTFYAGTAQAEQSSFMVSPDTVVAGSASGAELWVVLADAFANPVTHSTVTVTSSDGNDAIVGPALPDAEGVWAGTFTSTVAGSKTLTAYADGTPLISKTINVLVSGADHNSVTLTLNPNTLVAEGIAASAVTLQGRDALGNPLTGKAAMLSVDDANATFFGQTSLVLDGNGDAGTTLRTTKVGSFPVRAMVDDVTVVTRMVGVPGNPNGTQSALTFTGSTPIAADGVSNVVVGVRLRDALGHPIPNMAVHLDAPAGTFLGSADVVTDATGYANTTFTATRAGSQTISASALDLTLNGVVDVTSGPVALAQSTFVADPQSVTADGAQSVTLTLYLHDGQGNAVPQQTLDLSSDDPALQFAATSLITDPAGFATTTVGSGHAARATLFASAQGTVLSTVVPFLPGAPDANASTLTIEPNTLIADGNSQRAVVVQIRDVRGNPVPDISIAWLYGTLDINVTDATSITDGLGKATTFISGTEAGATQFQAQVPGFTLEAPITLLAGPASTTYSTFSLAPTTVVADGIQTSALTFTARDATGNKVIGQTITASTAGSTSVLSGPDATDAQGVWSGTARSLVAHQDIVTINAGSISMSSPIKFVAGAADANRSSSNVGAVSTVANGISSVNVSFILRDAQGNPVTQQPISVRVSGRDNNLTPSDGVTDASGQWSTALTSTRAEDKTIDATSGEINLTAHALFIAGAPNSSQSQVSVSPNNMVADGISQAQTTVRVMDAYGNPIMGQPVQIVPLGQGYALGSSAGITDAEGLWRTPLTATHAGAVGVTAVFSGASATTETSFVAGPPAVSTSALIASAPSFTADNNSTVTVLLQVRDRYSNPVPAAAVVFLSDIASDTLVTPSSQTDAQGALYSTLRASQLGYRTLTAHVGQIDLTTTVEGVSGAPSANTSSLMLNPKSVVADGSSAATVTLRLADTLGHPVGHYPVLLSATGAGVGFAETQGTTDEDGFYATTLTATRAETKTVTTHLGSTSLSGTMTFVAGPLDGNASRFTASPDVLLADGNTTTAVSLFAADFFSNPILGRQITLTSSGSANRFGTPSGLTNSEGIFGTTLSSTKAQSKTLFANVDGVSMSTQVNFVAPTIKSRTMTLVASPDMLVADGSLTTLRVVLRDGEGNLVPNQDVTLTASGMANRLSATTGMTDSNGQWSVTLGSTVAERKTIQVTTTDLTTATDVTFSPGPPDARASQWVAQPQQTTADGISITTLTATLRDAYGNPTPNIGVSWAAQGSGNRPGTTLGVTDNSGSYTATLASTVAETKSITLLAGGTSFTTQANFEPGPVSNVGSTLLSSPNTIVADNVSTAAVVANLVDAQGNPVSLTEVIFSGSGAGYQFSPDRVVSDASGRAATSMTGTLSGTMLITASTKDTTLTSPLTLIPGPPNDLKSDLALSPNGVTADGQSQATVVATVRDAFANRLIGQPVALSVSGTGATFAAPSGVTGSAGTYTTSIVGTVAELKTITAAVTGTSLYGQMLFVPGAPSPMTSTLIPTPSQTLADGNATIVLTLTLKDAFNNLIGASPTTLSASSAETYLDVDRSATDGNGVLLIHARSSKAQAQRVTATSGGTAINANIAFIAGAPSNQTIALYAQPAGQAADAITPIMVTLTVLDIFGNPIAGQNARLTSTVDTDVFVPASGVTGADGTLQTQCQATQSGTHVLQANIGTLVTTTTVNITAGSPNSALSSVALSPNQVVADGNSSATLVLAVRDGFGNLVPNQPVSLSLLGPDGGQTTLKPTGGMTNSAGTFTTRITATRAESKVLRVSYGGSSTDVSLLFVPGAVSPLTSTLVAEPNTLTADGVSGAAITVFLQDAKGNSVPYQSLNLMVSGARNTLDTSMGTTDAWGRFTTVLRSTKAEPKVLTVATNGTSVGGMVTFTPGAVSPAQSVLTASPNSLVADGRSQSTVNLVVRDAFGNSTPGLRVHFQGGDADIFAPADTTTDSDGGASTQVLSTQARVGTLSAVVGGAQIDIPMQWQAGPIHARYSFVTLSPNTRVADGNSLAQFNAYFRDYYNNPTSNRPVVFTGPGPRTQVIANTNTTDGLGQASAAVTSTLSGTQTLHAIAEGLDLASPIVFFAGQPNGAQSMLAASANTVVANGTAQSDLTLTVRDAFANAVPNTQVVWGGVTSPTLLFATVNVTNDLGQATARIKSTQAQQVNPTATFAGNALALPIYFIAGPASSLTSNVQFIPQSPNGIIADNVQGANVVVQLLDLYNNTVPNTGINIAFSGSALSAANASGVSDANGVYTKTLNTTYAGVVAASATVPVSGAAMNANAFFRAGPVAAGTSNTTIAPTSQYADNFNTTVLTFTARDAYSNPVPNVPTVFGASGQNIYFATLNGNTNAAGILSTTATTDTPQTSQLTVQATNYAYSGNMVWTPAPAWGGTSSIAASPNTGLPADNTTKTTITLVLRDRLQKTLPFYPVMARAVVPGRTFTSIYGTTDADGIWQTTMASRLAGPTPIRVVSGPGVLATTATFSTQAPYCSGNLMLPHRPSSNTRFGPAYRLLHADLNGDGNTDLISVGSDGGAGGLVVGLNRGNGDLYKNTVPPGVQGYISTMAQWNLPTIGIKATVANFIGTSALDVAVTQNNNTLVIMEGDGTGGFSNNLKLNMPFTLGIGVCSADFNRDGIQDILAVGMVTNDANTSNINMTTLLGNGNYQFTSVGSRALMGTPAGCSVADLNQDGNADIVIRTDQGFQSLLGRGDGTFRAPVLVSVPNISNLAVQDVDGDSYPDAVALTTDPTKTWVTYKGAGDGNFTVKFVQNLGYTMQSVQLIDVDKNGSLDIFGAQSTGLNVIFAANAGDGNFTNNPLSVPIYGAPPYFVPPYGSLPMSTLAADFTGDGNIDFVYSSGESWRHEIVINKGNLTFPKAGMLKNGYAYLAHIDANHDGFEDMIGIYNTDSTSPNTYIVLTNNKDRTFKETAFATPFIPKMVQVGDFNGDGNQDFVLAYASAGKAQVFLNQGDGNFLAQVPLVTGSNTLFTLTEDLTRDGCSDLVSLNADNNTITIHTAVANTQPQLSQTLSLTNKPSDILLMDVDTDGNLDLIVGFNLASMVHIYLGQPTGLFSTSPSQTYNLGTRRWNSIVGGDINLDGRPDIIFSANGLNSAAFCMRGLTGGTFNAVSDLTVKNAYYTSSFAYEDINGDGIADMIVAEGRQGSQVYLGTGPNSFASPSLYPTFLRNTPGGLVVWDFDGDQHPDIMSYGQNSSVSAARWNDGCQP